MSPIINNYKITLTDTPSLYHSLAGVSTQPTTVTDAAGELIITIIHEILHLSFSGNLADLSEKSNTMYYNTGGTGEGMIKYRLLEQYYTPGSFENKWKKFRRK